MSSFARTAASSFIRRVYCFWGEISSASSCSLLWRRSISGNSIVRGENPNPNPTPDHDNDNTDPNPNSRKQEEAPWLLLSSPTNPQSRYLYDLTIGLRDRNDDNDDPEEGTGGKIECFDIKLNRELHLPNIAERIFIGSSEGFLISINIAPYLKTSTIHVFNPLTGSHLPILRQFPFPCHPYYRDHGLAVSMKWKAPIQSIHVDPTFLNLYRTKAILSPSLDTIFILSHTDSYHSVFAPLSSSSTSSLRWIVFCQGEHWDDGIFHKGRFHATSWSGNLTTFDDLKFKNSYFMAYGPRTTQHCLRNSLVESPDGDDLFLVCRTIDDDNKWSDDPHPCHLISVYKLRFNQKTKEYEWDQVKSIGELAFFVGTKSSSLSLDVSDRHRFPSLKPNSVYFSDTWPFEDDSPEQKMISKAGVCTLEDETFHYIELSDGTHRQLNWPPPVWYMPTTPSLQG